MKRKLEKSSDEPDAKKVKTENDPKETEMIKKQMKKIYYYRDLLERNLKKNELQDLLEYNDQEVPEVFKKIHFFQNSRFSKIHFFSKFTFFKIHISRN